MPITKVTKQTHNFETLKRAALNGDLALLEVTVKATGEKAAAICAVNVERNPETGEPEYTFVPFALMIDGDPYELLDPPEP